MDAFVGCRLWSIPAGECINTLRQHTDEVAQDLIGTSRLMAGSYFTDSRITMYRQGHTFGLDVHAGDIWEVHVPQIHAHTHTCESCRASLIHVHDVVRTHNIISATPPISIHSPVVAGDFDMRRDIACSPIPSPAGAGGRLQPRRQLASLVWHG